MGGNAFDQAQRLTAEEYKAACKDINARLWNEGYMCDGDVFIPHAVRDKESYGDIDILACGYLIQDLKVTLCSHFECVGEIKNPSGYNLLLRFGDKTAQVDLNKVSEDDFGFAREYFSWNDLGNLVGRIAHRQGLKFGHDGLWYVHRIGDRQLGEILLTKDYYEALEYLGFDVVQYNRGFDTFEQMFSWVKDSKFFEPSAYPLEHRNHQARMRDKKRKTYQAFLQWINFDGEYVPSDKAAWLEKHKVAWPVLVSELDRLNHEHELNQRYKEKVNGLIVREMTGLEGKELGKLMNIVRDVLPRDTALQFTARIIEAGIRFAYEIYLEQK